MSETDTDTSENILVATGIRKEFGGLVEGIVTSPQFLNKRVDSDLAEE